MSQYHHITLYYAKDKEDIENFDFVANNINVDFVNIYLDEKVGSNAISHRYYKMKNWNKWHKKVKKIINSEREKYDLIHYISPIGFMEPGYLYDIDLPYIWGPIAGVHTWPMFLKKSNINILIEYIARYLMYPYLFFNKSVRNAMKKTDVIISATPETRNQIKKIYNRETLIFPENGIDNIEVSSAISENDSLNIFFNGGDEYIRKGLIILLDALAITKVEFTLHIVGNTNRKIKKYAELKGIKNILWYGSVSREEVQHIMLKCNLNIITSLSEGNPTIIWETMSKAIPTLTLDHCGMSNVICDNCGIKISINSYNSVIKEIAFHIENLSNNKYLITKLSQGTINCAKLFLWENRVKILNNLYDEVIKIHIERKKTTKIYNTNNY